MAVPIPIATASASARQRWTSARLSGPEIHFESPPAVAVRPSRVRADLSVTSGRPVRACFRNGWIEKARRGGFGPLGELDLDAGVAQDSRAAAARLLGGIVGEVDDARDARIDQRVGAWRLAPFVCARLQGHVGGGAGGIVAALGAVRERGALCVKAAQLGVPALADRLAVAGDDASRPWDWARRNRARVQPPRALFRGAYGRLGRPR